MKIVFFLFLILNLAPYPILADTLVDADRHRKARKEMVSKQIQRRGITTAEVLTAMLDTPRHHFVPKWLKSQAYSDHPLPIGEGQTISQPYIVALMTELLSVDEDDIALEIGTGSGYQAAILSKIVKDVYTIEIIKPLALKAEKLLARLGYSNISVKFGDGYYGSIYRRYR